MEFDIDQEAAEIADRVAVLWAAYQRAEAPIDLGDQREHSHSLAPVLAEILQKEFPDSHIRARVDGHRRILLTKQPR